MLAAYIEGHYHSPPSLQDFARVIGFHKGYLGQRTKQVTGQSFHQHVTRARMDEAKRLLRQTSGSVREVADRVGIHDVDYFTTQFKRYTGKTPSGFRKRSGVE